MGIVHLLPSSFEKRSNLPSCSYRSQARPRVYDISRWQSSVSGSINHEEDLLCNLNVVESPFPEIEKPSQPLSEFMTSEWTNPTNHYLLSKTAIVDGHTNQTR